MDMAGVDKAVVVQGISYGPLNDYVAGVVAAHRDRLIGCGMLDPFVEGSDRLYERIVGRMGFRTLKFECSVPTGLAGIHADFDYLASRWEQIGIRSTRTGSPSSSTRVCPAPSASTRSAWPRSLIVTAVAALSSPTLGFHRGRLPTPC